MADGWVALSALVDHSTPDSIALDTHRVLEYAKEHWALCVQLCSIGGRSPGPNLNGRGELVPCQFYNSLGHYRVCKHQAELYLQHLRRTYG
jgi:hypothetical protein